MPITKPTPSKHRINWRHPLANGLVYYLLPGGGYYNELVTGLPVTRNTNTDFTGGTYLGSAGKSIVDNSSGITSPFNPLIATIGQQYTIAVIADPSAIQNFGLIFAIPYRANGSWTSPFAAIFFGQNATGTQGRHYFSTNSSTFVITDSGSGFISQSDPLTHYGVSRNGTAVRFYRNGVFHSSTTASSASDPDFSNRAAPAVLGASGTGGMAGSNVLAAMWKRTLTDSDIHAFYSNPFGLLINPFMAMRT